jgi:hypothetical protein
MAGGFQTQVGGVPAPAVRGDFCDNNPRDTVIAGPGGLVAGALGVTVGRFAWMSYAGIDPDNAPTVVNSFGQGVPDGFVNRMGQKAIITTYLADSTMTIQPGAGLTLIASAGFWAQNEGTTQVTRGQKIYADLATGKASGAATGSPATASFTGTIAAETFSVTASVSGNVMTVSVVGAGTVVAGAVISGTNIPSGTTVVSQLGGTTGGVGTYALSSTELTIASETISGTYGQLTVSAVTGTIEVGGLVAGSGVTTGTYITAPISANVWAVNLTQAVGPEAMTSTTNVETKYYAATAANVGELFKMTPIVQ